MSKTEMVNEMLCRTAVHSKWDTKWEHARVELNIHLLNDRASPIAQLVKNLPAMQETVVQFLCQEDLLGNE